MNESAAPTRRRLVEGTLRCLRGKGVTGTTSREIAAEAGVNLAGITYHFGSKDELVAHALMDAIRRWLEPVLGVLRSDAEPVVKLTATVSVARSSFEELADLLPVYLDGLVHAARVPSLGADLDSLRREVRDVLASQIAALRDDGVVHEWVDPESMARLLVALADGMAVDAAIDPSLDVRRLADQALLLLLSARRA